MRLPVINLLHEFVKVNDPDYVIEAMEVLEHLAESKVTKNEELDVIGELLSNMSGALEVREMVQQGKSEKEAMIGFMKRVMGSIDK
ncbi:MAG: hypothetical protein GY816_20295 [Cytophagales bacterium]|nr:hypothetical protein [Cytophagales bacterium]